MRKMYNFFFLVIIISLGLLIACQSAEPTPTPSPTATSTLTPTQTATATQTAIPTATYTPTPSYNDFVELRRIQGPQEGIASLALNRKGTILAYGGYDDNSVHLLDVATGQEIMVLEGHSATVNALAFSPNGQLLASTGTVNLPPDIDGTVRIWDVRTGEQMAIFQTDGVSQLAFSPDGTLLGGARGGKTVQVILWDVETATEKIAINGVFRNFAFNPEGTLLASGGRDNVVHIIDTVSGEVVMSLSGHTGWISATAFDPNGQLLASGSDDKTIQLWDANTGEKLKSFIGSQSAVGALIFSPNGTVLASLGSGLNITREGGQITVTFGSADKLVRFWDIDTGEQIGLIQVDEGISAISFNSDWTVLATGSSNGLIQLWTAG